MPGARPSRGHRIAAMCAVVLSAACVACAACASGGAPVAPAPASTPAPKALAGPESSEASMARLDTFLTRLSGYGWGGTVWVHMPGAEPAAWAYGLADRERETPMTAQTRFDIGSLTKPFTAAAILKLEEAGALSVDDSLGRYLGDVPLDKREITLRHLLTHTAGLVRSARSLGVDADTDRGGFVRAVLTGPLLYAPGQRFEYSDTGYDLLAAIVEIVTKQSFESYLTEAVLAPAGLTRTSYLSQNPAAASTIALSYASPFGVPWLEEREGPSEPTWFNRGSGGLLSTAPELGRWLEALLEGRLLREETVRRMVSPQAERDDGSHYGYGWFIADGPEGRETWHGGDIGGYKAHLGWNAASGVRVAVLDNVFGFERVADRYIPGILRGEDVAPPPVTRAGPAAGETPLGSAEGVYRFADGGFVMVWAETGRVVVEVEGEEAVARVFGEAGGVRSADARAVIDALEAGTPGPIEARLRERDRAAGLAARLASIWGMLERRSGAVGAYSVLGTAPAQDGTKVSMARVERSGGEDLLRIVWRGDRLVAIGGPEGMRRPTALFAATGERTAARFEPSNGETTSLSVRDDCACIEFDGPLGTAVARRDDSSDLVPARSPIRELLPVFASRGAVAGVARLDALRRSEPGAPEIGEGTLNDLGYRLLGLGAIDEAIAVFRLAVTQHPDSWNAHDSLGEALLRAGREAEAKQSYARSLELNPDNETARRIVGEPGVTEP